MNRGHWGLAAIAASAAVLLVVPELQTLQPPQGYDEVTHLQNAWNVKQQLTEEGVGGVLNALQGDYASEERGGYWPAVGYLLTAPFFWIFQSSKAAIYFSVFATLLLGAITAMAGRNSALAIWVFASAGITVQFATTYTPVLSVALTSTLALFLLARGPEKLTFQTGALLGLALSGALLSDRLSGGFVLFLPIVWAIGRAIRTRQWLPLGSGLVIMLAFSSPFYWNWWARWQSLLSSAHGGEGSARALELIRWLISDGLGAASACIVAIGCLLWVRWAIAANRTPNSEPKTSPVWALAVVGTIPLLLQTEGEQSQWVGLIWAPIAIITSDIWHRYFAGKLIPAAAFGLTIWCCFNAVGTIMSPEEDVSPSFNTSNLFADDAIHASDKVVVIDLLQTKTGFSAIWLHYRWSVVPQATPVIWPLRRVHAAYMPSVDWLGEPCHIDRALIFHEGPLWNAPNEIERPLSFVGMDAYQERQYRKVMTRAGACWTVVTSEDIGDGRRLTVLHGGTAPPKVEDNASARLTQCQPDMALLQGEDGPYCMDQYEYPNQAGALPMTDVTWTEAQARCNELNKRLCTESEWVQACRGEAGTRYAYGNTFDPERCHTQANAYFDARDLKPIGSFPDCHNDRGVFDLNGGASEWVADTHQGPPFPDDNGPADRPCHIVRGGTMWDAAYGQDCNSRHWHAVGHQQSDDGFRCCADASNP